MQTKKQIIFGKAKILVFGLLFWANDTILKAQDTTIVEVVEIPNSDPNAIRVKLLDEVLISYQANQYTPISYLDMQGYQFTERSTGQEPAFIFSETPSVTAYSDGGGNQGYAYIRMRGIDQTRINFTFDGVPINEPEDQGAFLSNFPDLLNSVSKVQIQRGVGTTKNGMANYGGSVEMFSINSATRFLHFGADYGSFNNYRVFAEYNSGLLRKKTNFYLRASQLYGDGYKYNAANNSQSVYFKASHFTEKSAFKLNLLTGRQRNGLAWLGVADSLIQQDRRTNANAITEKDDFSQTLAQLQHEWSLSSKSQITTSLYYIYVTGNYDFDLNNFLGLPLTNELYNYNFESNLFGFFSNYNYNHWRNKFTVGIHANTYGRRHLGSEKQTGVLYSNVGYKQEASAFVKWEKSLEKWVFFADLQYRYTQFRYEGDVPLEIFSWQFLNPKAGITYRINSKWQLYYSIGRVGREPTRNDMFGGNDNLIVDGSNNPFIAIKDPEYVLDQALGMRWNASQNRFLHFNFYHMRFNNEIVLNGKFGPNGLALTNNVAQSTRTGVELSWSYGMKKWRWNHQSAWNYSEIVENNISFSPILTPPLIINQEIEYRLKQWKFVLVGRFQEASYIDFANTAQVGSYFLLNARVNWDYKNLSATLFANNLLDTQYFNNGYVEADGTRKYFVQMPTNFSLQLLFHFSKP